MLSINKREDISKMLRYYRTRDMLNLIIYFPEISPILDLTIIENEEDFIKNKDFIETFECNRADSLKGKGVLNGIENAGKKSEFFNTLRLIKEKDPEGVLVLFNTKYKPSERYERYAGISIGVDVLENVYIDAVGKGFDGREVSKGICVHERYVIPWSELGICCLENFKDFMVYQISDLEYATSRDERVSFLKSVGYNENEFDDFIPKKYEVIPNFVWQHVIDGVLKKLYKKEEELVSGGFNHFAISGHTEGKMFAPWSMFDKGRYDL